MSDYGDDVPPPEAEGLDRPSDNDDNLDDTAPEFNDPSTALHVDAGDDSDDESLLSEVDEAQFADFDATAVQVAPDFETLNRTIKVSKRKRVDGEEPRAKKRKEGTREKIKKNRRRQDSDDGFSGGEEIEGKRARKSKSGGDGEKVRRKPVLEEIDEEALAPEERRRRALDRAMDSAIKKSSAKRIRKGEIDLEQMADQEIEDMRNRMIGAAETDGKLVEQGLPASAKLKMLPEVVALMNRNTYVQALLDPETNLLEAVRFFLEPLTDGSLPAYNIQRELFAVLSKLPMSKDALIASGIGKVINFYTKSKRPELAIKRQATKLMEEWSRPILQRSDDYTKKEWTRAVYDPSKRRNEFTSQPALVQKARVSNAPGEKKSNRAQLLPGATSYTIVPQSINVIPRRLSFIRPYNLLKLLANIILDYRCRSASEYQSSLSSPPASRSILVHLRFDFQIKFRGQPEGNTDIELHCSIKKHSYSPRQLQDTQLGTLDSMDSNDPVGWPLFQILEIRAREALGTERPQNTGPEEYLAAETNMASADSDATITDPDFDSDSTLTDVEDDDLAELEHANPTLTVAAAPSTPTPISMDRENPLSTATATSSTPSSTNTDFTEMENTVRKRAAQLEEESDFDDSLPSTHDDDDGKDSDPDFSPVAKKAKRKTAAEGYVRWNPRRTATKRAVTTKETVDNGKYGKKSIEEDGGSDSEVGQADIGRDFCEDEFGAGDGNSEATTQRATSVDHFGATNEYAGNPDYQDQPELTPSQRGTAHLPPLPPVLPAYWTPRPDPTQQAVPDETIPGSRHQFAIGQEMFIVDEKKNTRTKFVMSELGVEVEQEDLTPKMYVVDERRVIRGMNEETQQPQDILCYFLTPRPNARGFVGNHVMVTEVRLVAVEYRIGEEVVYKLDRIKGNRLGMEKARVVGAYVRDGERLYVLRGTEKKIKYDHERKVWYDLEPVVVRDVVEGDILPAEAGKANNYTTWKPSFGLSGSV